MSTYIRLDWHFPGAKQHMSVDKISTDKVEGVATLDNVCSKKCSNEVLSRIATLSMESCFESMRMQASAS